MNSKRIAYGIGIVLAVLVAFTASAAADNIGCFDPQHGSADTDEYVPVMVYADIEAGSDLAGSGFTLKFDPDHIDIYSIDFACDDSDPTGPDQYCWGSLDVNATYKENGYIWAFTSDPLESVYVAVPPPAHWEWQSIVTHGIEGPLENVEMYRVWVHPQLNDTPGVSPFEFGFEMFPGGCPICQFTQWINWTGYTVPTTFVNGTFTHEGEIPVETFEKELATGWNLISLPLTASDMTIGSVFNSVGDSYSGEIYSYDAEANTFVVLTGTDVLANGVGYFISMNSADTWTYEGWNYTDMTVSLEQGLNMIGGLNCTKDIEDALSSIEGKYRYVSRWDAQAQKYEVYVPGAPSGLNDFDTMDRGKGYFISMKVDGETISEES